jgi:hypothetical protein
MTHRPVRGRRTAAAGLAVSAVLVLATAIYLGVWLVSGTPPFAAHPAPAVQVGAR